MSPEFVFFGVATVGALAAASVFVVPKRRHAFVGMAITWLCVSALALILLSPLVAVLVLALAGGTFAVGMNVREPDSVGPRSRVELITVLVGTGFVGFVLLGTLARQYETHGAELDHAAERLGGPFGATDGVVSELLGRGAALPVLAALPLFVALLVLVSHTRR